jgi:hypothetical protein
MTAAEPAPGRAHVVADGAGAAHRSSWPVKGRQEPVASRWNLSATEALEFGAGQAVVDC